MKKIIALIMAAAVTLSFSACGKKKEVVKEIADDAVNVTVEEVKERTIENTVTYTGEIAASESTSVSSKASGTAKAVYKEVGDYVSAGDVLLVIDDTDYRLAYNQAKAAYDSAVAQYNSVTNGSAQQTSLQLETALRSAEIEYNNAEVNYNNNKVLYENGAISKTAYDSAVTRYDNAKLNLKSARDNYNLTTGVVLKETAESAKASVNSAKAALENAQNALSNTRVVAPISGYIASKNANRGQMVAAGVEVYSIKATETIQANINVTESVIPYIKVGTKATVSIKSAGIDEIEGTVSIVNPTKSAQTGMYSVSVEILNDDNSIKDGMFVDVTLVLDEAEKALSIPAEAVLEDSDSALYVYVVSGDTAIRKDIETGIVNDEYAQIVSGLSAGEQVVVSGRDYITEKNNKIRVVK